MVGNPGNGRPRLMLTGPTTFELTESTTLTNVPTGAYRVAANTYTIDQPRIRTAWAPSGPSEVCPGGVLEVSWAQIASSGLMFLQRTNAGSEGTPLGYHGDVLAQDGLVLNPPGVSGASTSGGDMAFDTLGNLWTLSESTAFPTLQRYPAAQLGYADAPRAKTPDRGLTLASSNCVPDVVAIAFDPNGNLWVASKCGKKVSRVGASQLTASADVTAEVVVTDGLLAPTSLAFDRRGNLWVSDEGQLVRFDASTLASSGARAGRVVRVRVSEDAMNTDVHSPGALVFDRDGDLWTHDFGLNVLFEVPASALDGMGTAAVSPAVRIGLPVTALVEGLAFDDAGGLWMATMANHFGRLQPSQLTVSTGVGAPVQFATTVATYPGFVTSLATFPAPVWSPLYSAIP